MTARIVSLLVCVALLSACSHEDPNSPVYKRKQVFLNKCCIPARKCATCCAANPTGKPINSRPTPSNCRSCASAWQWFTELGKDDSKTAAKAGAINLNRADFDRDAKNLQDAVDQLKLKAATRDPAQIRPAFDAVENRCTECHKQFRDFLNCRVREH